VVSLKEGGRGMGFGSGSGWWDTLDVAQLEKLDGQRKME